MNKKINVYLPSFIARTTVNRCQSSVVDFEPDYVTRQGQGENQARNCSRKRLWGEPEHVIIDNQRDGNLAQIKIGQEVREAQQSAETVRTSLLPMMLFISRSECSNLLRVVDQILTFASYLIK